MKTSQFSGVGIGNTRVPLRLYLSSSTLRAPLRSSGLDERYIHGIMMPISIKAKPFASMRLNECSARNSGFKDNGVQFTDDNSEKLVDDTMKSYSVLLPSDENVGANLHVPLERAVGQKRCAKIHDFCFGIPYGGFLFTGGLFGFIFTRNTVSLTTSMLGAAIMILAAISLKVWRKELSSLPFMLGQAALAATLLVKHFRTYSSTKNLFPSGLYICMSVAMLCFYTYVLFSGGNPPPKQRLAATPPS